MSGKYIQIITVKALSFWKWFFHKMRKNQKQFYYLGLAIQQEIPIC